MKMDDSICRIVIGAIIGVVQDIRTLHPVRIQIVFGLVQARCLWPTVMKVILTENVDTQNGQVNNKNIKANNYDIQNK